MLRLGVLTVRLAADHLVERRDDLTETPLVVETVVDHLIDGQLASIQLVIRVEQVFLLQLLHLRRVRLHLLLVGSDVPSGRIQQVQIVDGCQLGHASLLSFLALQVRHQALNAARVVCLNPVELLLRKEVLLELVPTHLALLEEAHLLRCDRQRRVLLRELLELLHQLAVVLVQDLRKSRRPHRQLEHHFDECVALQVARSTALEQLRQLLNYSLDALRLVLVPNLHESQ